MSKKWSCQGESFFFFFSLLASIKWLVIAFQLDSFSTLYIVLIFWLKCWDFWKMKKRRALSWEKCVSGLQIFELASWAWLMLNVTHEMIDKIHNIVLEDHKVKTGKIAKIVGISNECVYIFHKHLQMRKQFPRWTPC